MATRAIARRTSAHPRRRRAATADVDHRMEKLRNLVGVTTSAVATEHFFTFSLSSLPTTKKFFGGPEATAQDKHDVRRSIMIAALLSIGTGAAVSKYVESPAPLVISTGMTALFWFLYERALDGKI